MFENLLEKIENYKMAYKEYSLPALMNANSLSWLCLSFG